jgi:hypothetical protein
MTFRIFLFGLFGDAFGPGYSGLAAARLPSANQALRIPIAFFYFVEI